MEEETVNALEDRIRDLSAGFEALLSAWKQRHPEDEEWLEECVGLMRAVGTAPPPKSANTPIDRTPAPA